MSGALQQRGRSTGGCQEQDKQGSTLRLVNRHPRPPAQQCRRPTRPHERLTTSTGRATAPNSWLPAPWSFWPILSKSILFFPFIVPKSAKLIIVHGWIGSSKIDMSGSSCSFFLLELIHFGWNPSDEFVLINV